jgi:hypothetical protein
MCKRVNWIQLAHSRPQFQTSEGGKTFKIFKNKMLRESLGSEMDEETR